MMIVGIWSRRAVSAFQPHNVFWSGALQSVPSPQAEAAASCFSWLLTTCARTSGLNWFEHPTMVSQLEEKLEIVCSCIRKPGSGSGGGSLGPNRLYTAGE